MKSNHPVTHFGKDSVTFGALTLFGLFIAITLLLYWMFGGFNGY
jgi:hypothetical protein